jgi:hypothetical protein
MIFGIDMSQTAEGKGGSVAGGLFQTTISKESLEERDNLTLPPLKISNISANDVRFTGSSSNNDARHILKDGGQYGLSSINGHSSS